MKKFVKAFLSVAVVLLFNAITFAQPMNENNALKVAQNFLMYHSSDFQLSNIETVSDDEESLAFVAHLTPTGFILISNSRLVTPVIAYSFESNWNFGGVEEEIFITLIYADLRNRQCFPDLSAYNIQKLDHLWSAYLSGTLNTNRFEQWPPEGTTPTGGWLMANWTQSAPYNAMCPIDPNTHQRGLAGCPAVAMAQIVNCIMEINGTRLTDADDYYHNFGVNNKYWIDNDWQEHGFPYFDSLNLYLDTLEYNYANNKPISQAQKAAINFACGTALKQVYSSSISGTYGMSQAGVAYQRFGFEESRLALSPDTTENRNLAENMKSGWPAHLGLVDPAQTVGHNVVVDGYNTDEFYHFNFGWGGSANGWYTMPPTSIPYNLTVIEGIVLDIFKGTSVGVNHDKPAANFAEVFYLPAENIVAINFSEPKHNQLEICFISVTGQVLDREIILTNEQQKYYEINPPKFSNGLVICILSDLHGLLLSKKMIILD
ncbi:MAG: C10 family peptidase [Bacteroidales bacterium]|nr:C10 family peptidase [Bacteroidales bacterium]